MDESPKDGDGFRKKIRDDLIKFVLLAIPVYVVNGLVEKAASLTTAEPWVLFGLALPAVIAMVIAVQIFRGKTEFQLNVRALVFMLAYVVVFTTISQSNLLFRRREVLDYQKRLPREPRWSLFSALGNWRYGVVPRPRPSGGLLVVTYDVTSIDNSRQILGNIIRSGWQRGARGIAIDKRLRDESDFDEFICAQVQLWGENPPILVGLLHDVDLRGPRIKFEPMSPSLYDCLRKRAHTSILPDPDGIVRSVPVDMPGRPDMKSLSWIAAGAIAKAGELELQQPSGRLVELVAPADTAPRWVTYDSLKATGFVEASERFLIVGSLTPDDLWPTPFGKRYGVELHAYAVQALLEGTMIRRPQWLWTMPAILVGCYSIMLATSRRRARFAVLVAALLSVSLVVVAVAAMRWGRVWLDVAFPLLAWWLFLAITILFTARRAALVRG